MNIRNFLHECGTLRSPNCYSRNFGISSLNEDTKGELAYKNANEKGFNPLATDLIGLMNTPTNNGKLVWSDGQTKPFRYVFKFNEKPEYLEMFVKNAEALVHNFNHDHNTDKRDGAFLRLSKTQNKEDKAGARDIYVLTYTDNTLKQDFNTDSITYKFMSSSGRSGSNGGNKGNNFEEEFGNAITQYRLGNKINKYSETLKQLETIIQKHRGKNFSLTNSLKPIINDKDSGVSLDGGKNQKRPILISGGGIEIQGGIANIGHTVTDITLIDKQGDQNNIYLSLKYGEKCVLINLGVADYFKETEMKNGEITNKIGRIFLDTFNIDNKAFCEVFNSVARRTPRNPDIKIPKEKVDVTGFADLKKIQHFLCSVIGYGFIWVHEINGHVHLLDVMTPQDTKRVVGDIKKCHVLYCRPGAKLVTYMIQTSTMDISMVIRNNSRGVYPAVVNLNYTLKHSSL